MPTQKKNIKMIDPLDTQLGKLLRLARNACGMSQEKLGEINGLTFQQIQKYERGHNRISVSRLMRMAKNLGIPAMWFVEKLNDNLPTEMRFSEIDLDLLGKHEVQEMLRSYASIANKEQRKFLRLIVALVADHATGGANG
ncbi:MAG: helix-turn-helix domain-containing protein [Alphaproteobacteria bacterium]|nr:helix-turn-helix domain-containing protein [Alphaproteobacteria bacterium]